MVCLDACFVSYWECLVITEIRGIGVNVIHSFLVFLFVSFSFSSSSLYCIYVRTVR